MKAVRKLNFTYTFHAANFFNASPTRARRLLNISPRRAPLSLSPPPCCWLKPRARKLWRQVEGSKADRRMLGGARGEPVFLPEGESERGRREGGRQRQKSNTSFSGWLAGSSGSSQNVARPCKARNWGSFCVRVCKAFTFTAPSTSVEKWRSCKLDLHVDPTDLGR